MINPLDHAINRSELTVTVNLAAVQDAPNRTASAQGYIDATTLA